jgi:hypothetical protein
MLTRRKSQSDMVEVQERGGAYVDYFDVIHSKDVIDRVDSARHAELIGDSVPARPVSITDGRNFEPVGVKRIAFPEVFPSDAAPHKTNLHHLTGHASSPLLIGSATKSGLKKRINLAIGSIISPLRVVNQLDG